MTGLCVGVSLAACVKCLSVFAKRVSVLNDRKDLQRYCLR
ncbi:hypothetical protein ABH909_002791 [Pseudomonas sp. BS3782 TE3695]